MYTFLLNNIALINKYFVQNISCLLHVPLNDLKKNFFSNWDFYIDREGTGRINGKTLVIKMLWS